MRGLPNFSVGFVVDGVDLSGLGTGALFDLEQVEIFRGPQSSAFGANALAGLINVESAEPSSTSERIVRFGLGGDGLLRTEGIVNAPIDDRLRCGPAISWPDRTVFEKTPTSI